MLIQLLALQPTLELHQTQGWSSQKLNIQYTVLDLRVA